MKISTISFGQKLREARLNKGLSQVALEELSNVSHRTIQRIESGKVNPRPSTLHILIETLDIDLLPEQETTTASDQEKSLKQLHLMNVCIMFSLVIPLLNMIIALLFLKFVLPKTSTMIQTAKKMTSFQMIWSLTCLLLFFLGVFIHNMITGNAGGGEYVGFSIYIACIFVNIYCIITTTMKLNQSNPNPLQSVPNFF